MKVAKCITVGLLQQLLQHMLWRGCVPLRNPRVERRQFLCSTVGEWWYGYPDLHEDMRLDVYLCCLTSLAKVIILAVGTFVAEATNGNSTTAVASDTTYESKSYH
jgi:hypothetical protein